MMSCDKYVALVDAQGSKIIAMLKAILCPRAKPTPQCAAGVSQCASDAWLGKHLRFESQPLDDFAWQSIDGVDLREPRISHQGQARKAKKGVKNVGHGVGPVGNSALFLILAL